ncbi:MAG: carbohydrate-binding domain-containing protein [Desulfobacteraceae bacterium]|nr:carbohydrate-binding domain-containing protein [Desulfobacteraceae bacterium]
MKTNKLLCYYFFVLLLLSSYLIRAAHASDLTNVIRILQVSVGLNVSVQTGDDANRDSKISMEDAIYILQVIAGLREETADEDAWKSNLGYIYLQGTSITYSGTGISVKGTTATIIAGGDYTVTGTLANGMIIVNTTEKAKLRLSGVNITNSSGPAIFISNADKAFITLTEGTVNYLTDGSSYSVEAKAALFSNDTLEIKGNGTLYVSGNYKHGIASDDDIIIENGTIIIRKSVKDGIHANNNVTINGGNLTITPTSDGIESEGDIIVNDGTVTVSAGDDGMVAATDLTINGGTVNVTKSVEGVESKGDIILNAGTVVIAATDDGLNAANNITINGGYLYSNTSSGDAIDSNGTLNINGGVTVATGGTVPEGGADCDQNVFTITGGTLVAAGGANSTPTSTTSTQPSVLLGSATAGSVVRINDSSGAEVTDLQSNKSIIRICCFTSPNLTLGKTYTVYTGGTISGGTNFYGLYTGATYSGGTVSRTFTTTSVVTSAGGTSGGGGGRP